MSAKGWSSVCGGVILLWLVVCSGVYSQELQCNVQVNSMKIEGTNRIVFQRLQQSLYEFMNNTAWTQHIYQEGERIECTMMLTLKEQIGSDEYKGMLNVQLRRPVYNASYNTPILNILDENIHFKYIENAPLEYSDGVHLSNLTSIFAFYAYVILGYDYDTFSPLGGQPHFEKARAIVESAQGVPERGWGAYEGNRKNRYWLVENMLNEKYRPYRRALYSYHRLGLDVMAERLPQGRGEVLNSLQSIQRVWRQKPDADMFVLHLFIEAKRDEIIGMYGGAPSSECARCANIMLEMDPMNRQRYEGMMQARNDV